MIDIDVVKRDGEVVKYDVNKIKSAIEKAFIQAGKSSSYKEEVGGVISSIEEEITSRFSDSELLINVENIHDIVEKHLMKGQLFEVAKSYIVYRAQKRQKESEDRKKLSFLKSLTVKKKNGETVSFNPKKLKETIKRHAKGLTSAVDQNLVFNETVKNIYNGMKSDDIDKALILSATAFIEQEPEYSDLAARFFRQRLGKEVFNKSTESDSPEYQKHYHKSLEISIRAGVEAGVFDARLLDFDFDLLAGSMVLDRDHLLRYISIQTLYERYLAKIDNRRIEMPQVFWMRVAMGLSYNEVDKNGKAIEFYNVMSQLLYIPSTPTLFHSGLVSPQLSSCYLTSVDDDLKHIFKSFSDNAQMAKWSGGIGNDWTNVRSTGSFINTTKVESQGVIPFLKIANDTTVAINRSGKRRGATAAYLETWHLDIEDFIDLRKNTGDERRRTPDMNTVNWIPDLFMKRVQENGTWTLFSPDEVPDLHHIYGKKFEERYCYYEKLTQENKIRRFKVVEAQKLFRKMITMLFETGHPWFCFKDSCNIRSPQDHVGVVHNSNLCTEITLNTKPTKFSPDETVKELGEVAVCLAEGTKILTDGGLKNIEDCNNVKVFVPLNSDTDHKHNPRFIKASLIDNGVKNVLTINTQFGPSLTLTENHLVMVYLKNDTLPKLIWKRADELRVGDRVFCPEHSSVVQSTNFDKKYGTLGWFLGDRWLTSSCGLVLSPADNYAEKEVVPVFNNLHGLLEIPEQLPSHIHDWTLDQQSSFLSGLFSADGGISISDKGITLHLSSSSLDVLKEVQVLLKTFGVHVRRTWFYVKDRNRWQGSLRTRSLQSINAFNKLIGFKLSPGKQEILSKYLENVKSQRNGLSYFKVKSIENSGEKRVYDLSLESGHHFIANGIVSHNCNIGSVNLYRHMQQFTGAWKMSWDLLKSTVRTAMRILDNVIDINFYPIPEAKNSNMLHRPVGLGFMGLQDTLFLADIRYEESDDFVDELQEFISYHAIKTSSELAEERGTYQTYKGSKWDRGIFPLDTIDLLEQERGMPVEVDRKTRLDWDALKQHVSTHGMRNSNTMALAPTATIANISGVLGPNGEAVFKNIFTKSNMSGEFTVVNEFLIQDLKKEGLWDLDMLNQIKYHNGSIQKIEKIPVRLRAKYKEVWEIDQKRSIDLTALRSKWIDQSQSHNIFIAHNNGKLLADIYMYAFKKGLKTTYYLRTLGVSGVEKATLDTKYGLTQKREEMPAIKACKINDPSCESCQ